MKFAVAVQSIRDLKFVKEPWAPIDSQNDIEAELQTTFFRIWQDTFGEVISPDRIIFGSEFCQYRLPAARVVKKALDYCWENGMDFSFATSYVHEEKFKQLADILSLLDEAIQESEKRIEVIVNDWGVYYYTKQNFPRLDIIIGRLLNKSIRDPRVAHYYNESNAPEEGKDFFKKTGLFSEPFRQFLNDGKVSGFEFDQLIQGNSLSEEEAKQTIGLHFPFGCVASGSACMVGFIDSDKADKFRGDPECKQQCQFYVFELKNKRHLDMKNRVFQKGNTAFYSHDSGLVKTGLESLQTIENARAVYSLRLPV
ncbi:hypothetical protein F9802_05970 [Bacillus aerolatus]|uniref:Uncharacterized protein n=1 Tax=Bacillus aerolatus TaxID=2653354 RepID=A0A6I1FP75_9BACI|nr:hypothetical protein [Bacillus aerolatus]KAB7708244.1 hypothetical protein F9802_05970 [Bacillus aerolatus]